MENKFDFELKKIWQWLIYIYVVLPFALFVIAFLMKDMNLGITFARIYHSYCLYVVNPVPHIPSYTGIFGAGMALFAIFKTLKSRDMKDFGISFAIIILNLAYYATATNYQFIKYLTFA